MTAPGRRRISRTAAAIGALAGGIAAGLLLRWLAPPWAPALVRGVGAIGQLWVAALRMTVLPLVVGMTLTAILRTPRDGSIGRLGLRSLAAFVILLVAVGILTCAAVAPVLRMMPVGPDTAAAFRSGVAAPAAPGEPAAPSAPSSPFGWLLALIPANPFQAAASGEVLPILVFTLAFGLAANRLPSESRDFIGALAAALSDAMLVMIGWILRVLPLGVFALAADLAFRVGLGVTGVIGYYVGLLCAALIAFLLLLYPLTSALARVPVARFARAAARAQAVAASTRSSLAALPALVDGGRRHLALPDSATGFVLPLSVSVFKLNRTVSSPLKLLFLAHVFGVRLDLFQVAAFLAMQVALSFSTAGIPSMGTVRSIPAYVAVGIPLEGVVLLDAVEAIPDIFKTVLNVTGDLSVAAILTRRERSRLAAPEPQRAPERAASGGALP